MYPYQNLSLEDMPGEVWKDIPGFNGHYQASNMGRIKSFKYYKAKIMSQVRQHNDYLTVVLCRSGSGTRRYIHRIVMQTFDPDNSFKREVDHINGIKVDNRVENLQWVTSKENKHNAISEAKYAIANSLMGKPVICTDMFGNETRYASLREAARDGFCRRCIMFCLNGKHRTHKKHTFRYAD